MGCSGSKAVQPKAASHVNTNGRYNSVPKRAPAAPPRNDRYREGDRHRGSRQPGEPSRGRGGYQGQDDRPTRDRGYSSDRPAPTRRRRDGVF